MTSKLLIAYPDIPRNALVMSTTADVPDPEHGFKQFISGRLANVTKMATPSISSYDCDFDLGTGNTQSVEYLIIGRADLLQGDSVDNILLYADDNSLFSSPDTVFSDTSWNSDALTGPFSQDYIATFTASTAYRYWRFRASCDGGASSLYAFSKLYFGIFWDAGIDPSAFHYSVKYPADTALEMSTGNVSFVKGSEYGYRFEFTWEGVSDANVNSFADKLLSNPYDNYVYLYETGNNELLADMELVYCRIIAEETLVSKTDTLDWNIITAVFEQVIK